MEIFEVESIACDLGDLSSKGFNQLRSRHGILVINTSASTIVSNVDELPYLSANGGFIYMAVTISGEQGSVSASCE